MNFDLNFNVWKKWVDLKMFMSSVFFCIIFRLCRIYVLFFVPYNMNFDDVCNLHICLMYSHTTYVYLKLHCRVQSNYTEFVCLNLLWIKFRLPKVCYFLYINFNVCSWNFTRGTGTRRYNAILICWSRNCDEIITQIVWFLLLFDVFAFFDEWITNETIKYYLKSM